MSREKMYRLKDSKVLWDTLIIKMKVQFFTIEDMMREFDPKTPEYRGYKPLIRIQSIRRSITTKENVPIQEFEIRVTALVDSELWYYIRPCGSKIIFDTEELNIKIKEVEVVEKEIKDTFEKVGFKVSKGMYREKNYG